MARVEHWPVRRLRRWPVTAVPTTGFEDKWPLGTGSNAKFNLLSTQTRYTHDWWEDARQSVITYTSGPDSGTGAPPTSTFAYYRNDRVASIVINDARDRTVTFVTDAQGQVLIRTELDLITTTDDSSDL